MLTLSFALCAGLPGRQGAPGITPQPEEITAPAGLPGLPGIDGVPGFDGDHGFQGPAGKPGKTYTWITEMLSQSPDGNLNLRSDVASDRDQ